jgi:3-deoxy-D-manno-octulosonic-acid transferase
VHRLYSLLLYVGVTLAAPWLLLKDRRTGKYRTTFADRLGRLPAGLAADPRPALWIHAVSVGEVKAAVPLVAALKQRFPGHRVLLSTTTLTGNAVARGEPRHDDGLFFAPFDTPGAVRRVLDALRPALVVLMETELWPNLIHEARRRGARVVLVNGRISDRSFPRYRRLRWFFRRVLGELDALLVQEEQHRERLIAMGAPPARVRVLGSLKYDALEAPETPPELARQLGVGAPLLVAGSTVEGEEPLVLDAFRRLQAEWPRLRLLIAPRHPERFEAVAALVASAGLRCARRSRLTQSAWRDEEVLLLDTLGELARVYALASVVFVGGSLVPRGGHNILEAAVAGKPILVGPHMQNFKAIAEDFRAAGALVEVSDAVGLEGEIGALLRDEPRRAALGASARAVVERSRGALARTLDALAELVS